MISRTVGLLLILTCIAGYSPVFAQEAAENAIQTAVKEKNKGQKSLFDELQGEEFIEMTLRTDFTRLLNSEPSEDYFAGELSWEGPSRSTASIQVEIRPRGKFRRRICDFPPLKLKFPKESLREHGVNTEYRSMKLVTHCLDDKDPGNENVLREYLTYKLYNELTENSYRVQLIRLTYVDSGGRQGSVRRFGFLIEDSDELANRLGGKECENCLNPPLESLSAKDATLLSVFQYMIGNADWTPAAMRNVKLVERQGQGNHLLVPYDFDFAGLVNASYAIPSTDLQLRSVRDRAFIGYPVENDLFRWALNYIRFKEKALYGIIADFRYLSRDSRTEMENYLRHFFQHLEAMDINQSENLYQRLSEAPLKFSTPAGSGQ